MTALVWAAAFAPLAWVLIVWRRAQRRLLCLEAAVRVARERAERQVAAAPTAPADPPPTEDEVDRWDRETRQWQAELERDAGRRRALAQAERQAANTVGLRARLLHASVLLEVPFEYEGERPQ